MWGNRANTGALEGSVVTGWGSTGQIGHVEVSLRAAVLEGLPVDGPCSVLLILLLTDPHLLKGVQRRQDGATTQNTRGMRGE